MHDKPISQTPFHDDADYLDAEFSWIRSHVGVLDVEKQLADAQADTPDPRGRRIGKCRQVAADELTRRLNEQKSNEAEFRKQLDGRIAVHRRDGAFTIGMDTLCDRYDLSQAERFMLLVLSLPAVSPVMAEEIFFNTGFFGGSMTVGQLVGLLRPQGAADWLRFRQLFRVSSPLVRHGLITMNYYNKSTVPGDLWNADVAVSAQALAVIVGDPDIDDNAEPADDADNGDMNGVQK